MSGGGNKPVQGRMGQCLVKEISHKEIEKLEKELQEDMDRLEVCLREICRFESFESNSSKVISAGCNEIFWVTLK